ncbi:MAG: ComF family protein [Neisseriaceae bacterium]|nr:ComF family protein [Neisseriaceae bacterium]
MPVKNTAHAYLAVCQKLFTTMCLFCELNKSSHLGACIACWKALPVMQKMACPCCGQPSAEAQLCGHCQRNPPYFEALISAFRYDYPIRSVIQRYKYGKKINLSNQLGLLLYSQMPIDLAIKWQAEAILPIPLSKERLKERGFNQSHGLAKILSQHWQLPLLDHIVLRTRHTERQAQLSLQERVKNVRNAFSFNHKHQSNFSFRCVIIVDDVATSGATLSAVAQLLKINGVEKVYALTLARALL